MLVNDIIFKMMVNTSALSNCVDFFYFFSKSTFTFGILMTLYPV